MNLRSLTLLALVGGLSFAAACSDDTPTGPDNGGFANIDTSDTYPLTVGNEWVYKTTRVTATSTTVDTNTATAVRDTMIDGKRWTFRGYLGSTLSLYRSDATGAYYYQTIPNRELLVFKRPPKIGDTVMGSSGYAFCFVLDTVITVPAGKFRCIGYREESPSSNETFYKYFAPGAGPILTQTFDLANKETWRHELIRYTFK
jgi:hypothetical protein